MSPKPESITLCAFCGYLLVDEQRCADIIYTKMDWPAINTLAQEHGKHHPLTAQEIRTQLTRLRHTEAHQALVAKYSTKPVSLKERIADFLTDWLVRK